MENSKKSKLGGKIALGVLALALIGAGSYHFFVPMQRSAIEVIHHRSSIRSFTSDPISDKQIETILRAGMAAPTAMNSQPWAFIVLRNPEEIKKLTQSIPHGKALETATAAIVTCCLDEKTIKGESNAMWQQDCSAATQNMLLAIDAQGLGGVWLGVYPVKNRMEGLRSSLSIPDGVTPFSVIALGHPAGEAKPKEKYQPDRVHFGKW